MLNPSNNMKFYLRRRFRSGIGTLMNTLRHLEHIHKSEPPSVQRVQRRSGLQNIDLRIVHQRAHTNVHGTIEIGNWLRTSSSLEPCFSNRSYSTPLHARDVLKWVTAVEAFNRSECKSSECAMDPANGPSVDFTIAFSVQTGENHMDWIHNVAHVTQRVEDPGCLQHPGTFARRWMNVCRWSQPRITSFQTRLMESGISHTQVSVRVKDDTDATADSDDSIVCKSSWSMDEHRETLIQYVESIPGVILKK